jgi:hypothetical protein
MHQRKIIRHAVAKLLIGKTAAAERVYRTRVEPLKKQLPAVSVYTLSEPVEVESLDVEPRELKRELKLDITAWVAHSEANPADDQMDDIAEQIEAVMDANRFIDFQAADSVLENTEITVLDDGDPMVGVITMTYSVSYRTEPTVENLDDFNRVATTTLVVGGAPDHQPVHDSFVVQEPA